MRDGLIVCPIRVSFLSLEYGCCFCHFTIVLSDVVFLCSQENHVARKHRERSAAHRARV